VRNTQETRTARLASMAPVHVGQRFTVRFTLRNDGERTARRIHVSADYSPRELSLVRAASTKVSQLRAGRSATGSFLFTARHRGNVSIFFGASTTSNHPGDDITLTIRPKK
jgi:CARDB